MAPVLGIELYDRRWDEWGGSDPLATWFITSGVTNPDYWYGKAEAFWTAYEEAVGIEAFSRVLAATDDDLALHPLDGRWFIDCGEIESGENLDQLFLDWVWVEVVAKELLTERRAAWDTVAPLRERVEEKELAGLPKDLRARTGCVDLCGREQPHGGCVYSLGQHR